MKSRDTKEAVSKFIIFIFIKDTYLGLCFGLFLLQTANS